MKKKLVAIIAVMIFGAFSANNAFAKSAHKTIQQDSTQVAEELLDKAVAAQESGNNDALVQSLNAGTIALEKEANADKGSFKDKILGQVGALQKLTPMVKSGLLKGDMLKKVVNMVKMLGCVTNLVDSSKSVKFVDGKLQHLRIIVKHI